MRYELDGVAGATPVAGAARPRRPARGGLAPMVALHGFLGTPATWLAVVDRLDAPGAREPESPGAASASPRRVALGVLPGHGREPWVPEGASFLEIADAMARAIPFDEPSVLVGYSMGGRLALAMAALHPSRFRSVIVVGASAGLADDAERRARAASDDAQAERLLAFGLSAFVDAWEDLPLFATQRQLDPAARAAVRRERLAHTEAGLAWAVSTLGLGRMPRVDLARCRVSLVAVAGARDEKYAALAGGIALEAPSARARIVEGAGHNVALEAPAALAAVIGEARRPAWTEERDHG